MNEQLNLDKLVEEYNAKDGLCLIVPRPEQVMTAGGIFLPDRRAPEEMVGLVVSIGPVRLKNGQTVDPGFAVDDWVVYTRWAGNELEFPDGSVVVCRIKDVVAVWEEDDASDN